MRSAFPDARWISAESLHLTLIFLGWTSPADVPGVARAAAGAARQATPFELEIGDAGGNARGDRPGVAWLHLAHGAPEVTALVGTLDARLREEAIDATWDAALGRRPHLTVARRASRELIEALRSTPRPPVGWRADAITVFRSHLGPAGSRFEPLAVEPLAGSPGTTRA